MIFSNIHGKTNFMMWIRLLTIFLLGTQAQNAEICSPSESYDEEQYTCTLGYGVVKLATQRNNYVKIKCEGVSIPCEEMPRFDFAGGVSLGSLSVESCSPRFLRCVNDVINAKSLEIVTLTRLREPLTAEDVKNLGSVKALVILQAEVETSVPISAIAAIPSLNHLRIGEGNLQLSPNIFQNSPPLKYLELRRDHLTSLPPDGLNGLGNLTVLNVWGNNIEVISAGAFRGLNSLVNISLSLNTVKYKIEPGAFADTSKLQSIIITLDHIESVPNGLLQGLQHLKQFNIRANAIEVILGTHAFSQLPRLQEMHITDSKINILPEDLFSGSVNIETINLNANNISVLPANIFRNMTNLKRLELRFNKIQALPEGIFTGLKSLEALDLTRNLIEILPAFLFSGLINLKTVTFHINQLTTIEDTAFKGAESITHLSLQSNNLTLESKNTRSPFRDLKKLQYLYLADNKIKTLLEDFRGLLELKYLDLSSNEFQSLQCNNGQMHFLSDVTINVKSNNISYITFDQMVPSVNNDLKAKVLLENNPLQCDCLMYPLKIRVEETRSMSDEPKFVLGNTICLAPPNLAGVSTDDILAEDLTCDLSEICPDTCKCLAKVATNEVIIHCPDMPSTLPNTTNDIIRPYFEKEPTLTVNLDKKIETLGELKIFKLNLSHTGIEEIKFQPPKALRILDVSNNNLKRVPMEFLAANVTLYLSNNNLTCECGNKDDLSALIVYGYVQDFEQVICNKGPKLIELYIDGLCSTRDAVLISVFTFVFIVFCVIAVIIIVYRNSKEIIVFMISRNILPGCFTKTIEDEDKKYDIFIAFAHGDFMEVEDALKPKLETEYNQKLCLHYRDWIVGDEILTQIQRSVESSRKTMIILSKNFLQSKWANLEFNYAHSLTKHELKSRLILILLDENVLKHENLSDDIQAYLNTNTYLLWTDPRFWAKLNKVLPKVEHKFKWLEAFKRNRNVNRKKHENISLDVQFNQNSELVNLMGRNIMYDGNELLDDNDL